MKILSVENTHSWSWGIVIQELMRQLPAHECVRVLRGEFHCPNPRCNQVYHRNVDPDLEKYFDVLLPQNCDSIRLIAAGDKTVARIGGLDMGNPDTARYSADFERVAAIVATNQQLANIALAANPNTVLIPNGVDLDTFVPAVPNPNFDRRFTMGFAGNIWGGGAEYKGWQYFVMAQCLLAAEGVEQIHLLHNANQIPHADMPTGFYHKIDALILPSRGEGCSNVVSEALACGVPVLTTKVGYHGEMLIDELNCLFIERDANMIADTIRRLLSDTELRTRLAVNGRKFAEEYHDVKKVAAAYDKVFQQVINANPERKVG